MARVPVGNTCIRQRRLDRPCWGYSRPQCGISSRSRSQTSTHRSPCRSDGGEASRRERHRNSERLRSCALVSQRHGRHGGLLDVQRRHILLARPGRHVATRSVRLRIARFSEATVCRLLCDVIPRQAARDLLGRAKDLTRATARRRGTTFVCTARSSHCHTGRRTGLWAFRGWISGPRACTTLGWGWSSGRLTDLSTWAVIVLPTP